MPKLVLQCEGCQVEFTRYPSQAGPFCSRRCNAKSRLGPAGAKSARQRAALLRESVILPDLPDSIAAPVSSTAYTLLSPEDADLLSRTWTWSHGYATEMITHTRLHRLVLSRVIGRELRSDEIVDHVNRDKLDNRRSNLRIATVRENSANQGPRSASGYKGVYFDEKRQRYGAYITADGVRMNVGRFENPAEAAWMFDQWALALHRDFAYTNFEYV